MRGRRGGHGGWTAVVWWKGGETAGRRGCVVQWSGVVRGEKCWAPPVSTVHPARTPSLSIQSLSQTTSICRASTPVYTGDACLHSRNRLQPLRHG